MPIENIYSFLTYPRNHAKAEEEIEGIHIKPDKSKLTGMLSDVFDGERSRRDVPIRFVTSDKKNVMRGTLIAFMDKPKLATALPLAKLLQTSTPGTAGMGLFFVCLGSDEGKPGKRVVLSRFAAEEAVVASKIRGSLTVEFLEQVFLKNAHSYKAAVYTHEDGKNDAWKGIATDRQLNHGAKAIADYWIVHFLLSELTTTGPEGTRRLAIAMRDASKTGDIEVRSEIVAAAKLAKNMPDDAMTVDQFCVKFALSPAASAAVKASVQPNRLVDEPFRFDAAEFVRHVQYKQVELDNEVTLTAPTDTFDQVLEQKRVGDQHSFATRGKIVNEKLRSNR